MLFSSFFLFASETLRPIDVQEKWNAWSHPPVVSLTPKGAKDGEAQAKDFAKELAKTEAFSKYTKERDIGGLYRITGRRNTLDDLNGTFSMYAVANPEQKYTAIVRGAKTFKAFSDFLITLLATYEKREEIFKSSAVPAVAATLGPTSTVLEVPPDARGKAIQELDHQTSVIASAPRKDTWPSYRITGKTETGVSVLSTFLATCYNWGILKPRFVPGAVETEGTRTPPTARPLEPEYDGDPPTTPRVTGAAQSGATRQSIVVQHSKDKAKPDSALQSLRATCAHVLQWCWKPKHCCVLTVAAAVTVLIAFRKQLGMYWSKCRPALGL
jgi:hypothetical protein